MGSWGGRGPAEPGRGFGVLLRRCAPVCSEAPVPSRSPVELFGQAPQGSSSRRLDVCPLRSPASRLPTALPRAAGAAERRRGGRGPVCWRLLLRPSSLDTPVLMAPALPALPGAGPGLGALPSEPWNLDPAFVVGERLQGDRLCLRSCRGQTGAGSAAVLARALPIAPGPRRRPGGIDSVAGSPLGTAASPLPCVQGSRGGPSCSLTLIIRSAVPHCPSVHPSFPPLLRRGGAVQQRLLRAGAGLWWGCPRAEAPGFRGCCGLCAAAVTAAFRLREAGSGP